MTTDLASSRSLSRAVKAFMRRLIPSLSLKKGLGNPEETEIDVNGIR